uniref:Uncharacterized protein n=1 Tax=Aliivibrio fischeri TaxID=668 RepID=H2ERQ3_ALIFS|nr:hypothetical protein [Aliivibrio fischeri]
MFTAFLRNITTKNSNTTISGSMKVFTMMNKKNHIIDLLGITANGLK